PTTPTESPFRPCVAPQFVPADVCCTVWLNPEYSTPPPPWVSCGGPTARITAVMVSVLSFSSTLSNTIPSDDCGSPPDRAFASVMCPMTFVPRGMSVPFGKCSSPIVFTTTSSPAFFFLESSEAARVPPIRNWVVVEALPPIWIVPAPSTAAPATPSFATTSVVCPPVTPTLPTYPPSPGTLTSTW